MNDISKKIYIVLPFFGDGGMERAMINLSEGFLARNYFVNLILLKKGYGSLVSEIPKNVKVTELKTSNYYNRYRRLFNYLRTSESGYIISLATPTNLICILINLFMGKKFTLLVSTQVTLVDVGKFNLLKYAIKRVIYRLYNMADAVHAASKGVSDDLVRLGVSRSKIKVIYNPIISPKIIESSSETLTDEWFNQKSIPVILGIGRLVEQKDFPTLIRAFALARKDKLMRLAILGEGEQKDSLLKLAKELHVEEDFCLLGFSNNPYKYLRQSNLFVLSSAWEGFGNVLAEAIALGVPSVSTDCPHGPKEILSNGKYGKLVSVGDYKGLSEAISNTLINPLASDFLRSGAKRFAVDHVTEEYLKVFSEISNGK